VKVVIDDKIPFIKNVLEPYADVVYLPGGKITRDDLMDADALITRTRTKCNEKLLSGTKVKFIASATIGYDHIDTAWCEKNGITWTNAPGCNSGSVYQYMGSVLAVQSREYGMNLSDCTLGVIGVGNVGKKIVRLGEILGMKILKNDPPRERTEGSEGFCSLDELIQKSDIVTCHVPLNLDGIDKTFHLFDNMRLRELSPNAIFINCSRGEVVYNHSLVRIIKEKKIRSAVLDVWENEPDIDIELLDLVDLATPHIAGYSGDGKGNGTSMSVQALSRFFNLPLAEWQTDEVPAPENAVFEIDCSKQSPLDSVLDAIMLTYDVREDSLRLKVSRKTFEKQRGDYPLRREFHAYTVSLKNENSQTRKMLTDLGFKIQ
jgi:erythronate-4-phosphate dehydrogenase